MKRSGKILLCASVSLAAAVAAHAVTEGSNPYQKIVDRNVFGLKPPPPPPDPESLKPPPPKITLQGINTFFGVRQVLFKVAPAKPGEKEQSYVLTEGQGQDEIEVVSIDDKEGVIKFDNHGTLQTLTMKDDATKPAAGNVAMPGAIPRPGGPILTPNARPGSAPSPGGGSSVTSIGGPPGLRQIPSRPTRTETAGATAVTTAGTSTTGTAKKEAPPLTVPEQIVLIEALRPVAEKDPTMPPLPPTPLTPPGSKGLEGVPIPPMPPEP